jgi:uncharacterized membrane protein
MTVWLTRGALLLSAGMSVGMSACTDKGADSGAEVSCDRQPPLSWENFGEGFMGLHCTGCHSVLYPAYLRSGAPEEVNFNTFYDVVQWVERIEIRATGDDPQMPPAGGPTDEERELLTEWLTCNVWPTHDALEEQGQL